jgi:AraC family transcriptional regulator of adaptative response/methylated-DNA-[protein]-cysteine methyltransferase
MQSDPSRVLSLSELAGRAGVSDSHFHRTFRKLVGTTPKKYADGLRIASLKRELKTRGQVTASMYASGFGSSSRVYERSDRELGMTPAQYMAGGKEVTITYVCTLSPLGRMMLGATDRGLCFLQFGESCEVLLETLRKEFSKATLEPMQRPAHADLESWLAGLDGYLRGSQASLEMPVDVRATAFQLRVWDYLRGIPYGQVECYSGIAQKLGVPKSTRAVARAIASNPIALLVPCHRVIRNNGELGGYRWGMERKRALLEMEGLSVGRTTARVSTGGAAH